MTDPCGCWPPYEPLKGDRWYCEHGVRFKAVAVNLIAVNYTPPTDPLYVWYRTSWRRTLH